MANTDALRSKGELRMAGMVTSFAHRTTKTGKPFGTLTMEDYHGGHTFFIFGEDYVKFKEYFMTGWYLYITGSVHPNRWKENEFEFKINSIMLLGEVRAKMIKGLRINIDLDDLSLDLMEKLEVITKKYKGEAKLYINVIDSKEQHAHGNVVLLFVSVASLILHGVQRSFAAEDEIVFARLIGGAVEANLLMVTAGNSQVANFAGHNLAKSFENSHPFVIGKGPRLRVAVSVGHCI